MARFSKMNKIKLLTISWYVLPPLLQILFQDLISFIMVMIWCWLYAILVGIVGVYNRVKYERALRAYYPEKYSDMMEARESGFALGITFRLGKSFDKIQKLADMLDENEALEETKPYVGNIKVLEKMMVACWAMGVFYPFINACWLALVCMILK